MLRGWADGVTCRPNFKIGSGPGPLIPKIIENEKKTED